MQHTFILAVLTEVWGGGDQNVEFYNLEGWGRKMFWNCGFPHFV